MKTVSSLFLGFLLFFFHLSVAQNCPDGKKLDQTIYGVNQWIGYVYNGVANFNSNDHQGTISETENFDESFCGDDCDFATSVCSVNSQTFTVRYRMQKTLSCGTYYFEIGGDDGVRLSLDGGATYAINEWGDHSFTNYSSYVYLSEDKTYDMVLDYYEREGQNRVRFNMTYMGSDFGGLISGEQTTCGEATIDPTAFQSITGAAFCPGPTAVNYQWQVSTDQASWANIASATAETYDIPAGFSGTKYYRRKADDGNGTLAYSNTLRVAAQMPEGNQVDYGNGSWIGYIYDGRDNYTDYKGRIFESETFDENFGGGYTTFSTTGCETYTETFTARFKMQKDFDCGEYTFTVGGDDGFRLSVDGGATYIIDSYTNHSYGTVSSSSIYLDSTVNLVLEYFEDGGDNRLTFSYVQDKNCALPVTLENFEGKAEDTQVALSWSTSLEINNDYFEVERSADGRSFEVVGRVEGRGQYTHMAYYFFEDKMPEAGINYYRLKQVDYDGQYEYSTIIAVNFESDFSMKLYPNPAASNLSVNYPGSSSNSASYTIANTFGYQVKSGIINPDVSGKAIQVDDLKEGVYLLTLIANNEKFHQQLIIRR